MYSHCFCIEVSSSDVVDHKLLLDVFRSGSLAGHNTDHPLPFQQRFFRMRHKGAGNAFRHVQRARYLCEFHVALALALVLAARLAVWFLGWLLDGCLASRRLAAWLAAWTLRCPRTFLRPLCPAPRARQTGRPPLSAPPPAPGKEANSKKNIT